MKVPTWLEAVLGVALILAGWSWFRSHEALRDALAQQDVLKQEKQDLQGRIEAAGKAEKAANQALEAERRKPATVETVTHYLPVTLPGKIEIVHDATGSPVLAVSGDVQANLNAIQDMEIKCLECQNSLKARTDQYSDLQKQLAISEQNAENWKKAAGKGQGFWARTKEWGIRAGFAAGGYAAGRVMK